MPRYVPCLVDVGTIDATADGIAAGRPGMGLTLSIPLDAEFGQVPVEDLGGNGRDGLAALDRRKLEPVEDGIGQAELPTLGGFPNRSGSAGASFRLRLGRSCPPALPFGLGLIFNRIASGGLRRRLRRG